MSRSGVVIDERVLAERIANVVNRKIASLVEEINQLKVDIEEAKHQVKSVRQEVVEASIKSVSSALLSIRLNDFVGDLQSAVRGIEKTCASHLSQIRNDVGRVIEGMSIMGQAIGNIVSRLESVEKQVAANADIKAEVERIKEEIRALKEKATAIESSGEKVRELNNRLEGLSKQVGELSAKLADMEQRIVNVEAMLRYIHDAVKAAIEEREEEEETEEEEEEGEE